MSVNVAVPRAKRAFAASRLGLLLLVAICWLFSGSMAFAQSSGKPRATKVAVAEVTTETIADFAELQGRLVAGATESVTAVTSAEIEILDLQLGDVVAKGQDIAQARSCKTGFEPRYASGPACRNKFKTCDITAEIESESALLQIAEQRVALLDRKADRVPRIWSRITPCQLTPPKQR